MAKMNRKRLFKNTRCGAVLPLVVLIVLLLMIIGLSVTGLGLHSRLFAIRSAVDVTARSAADAAISNAIFQMNEKLKVKPWDDSSLPAGSNVELLQCDATFDYAVSKDSGIYSVQGTGRAGNRVRVINSTLRLYSPFDFAVFARGELELKNSAVVDWYNNQPGDWPLQVGTASAGAGAVTLMSGTTINGDIIVGVGGDPNVVVNSKTGILVTGDVYPFLYEPVLPPVTAPTLPSASPSTITNSRTISTSGMYSSINLGNNEVITIDGPVTLYIIGDVKLSGTQGRIEILNGASLTMYIGGNFNAGNSAGFNNFTKDAKKLSIYGLPTCTSIVLKNSSDFYGAIYAPNANMELKDSADVYGSIVTNGFIMKNSGNVRYDASLRDRTVNDEGVRFVIARWSEQ
jgi:hypothetical protein